MRAFSVFAIAALCVAVAYGMSIPYPDAVLEASSELKTPIGHFYAELQVPPEPKDISKQTLVYFVGASMSYMFRGRGPVRGGMALMWDAQNHWRAMAAAKVCNGFLNDDCTLSWENEAVLAAEPGDVVFLNISNVPGKDFAGYEVSLPFKAQTTGFRTGLWIDQSRFNGISVTVNAVGVTWANQFPVGTTNLLKILYRTAANATVELPLNWKTDGKNKWGQEFVQKGNILTFNWQ